MRPLSRRHCPRLIMSIAKDPMSVIKSALLLTLFLGACNPIVFAQGQPENELYKALDKQVYQLMHKGNVPGLSLILIRNGRQEIRNYGYADLDKRNAVTAHT